MLKTNHQHFIHLIDLFFEKNEDVFILTIVTTYVNLKNDKIENILNLKMINLLNISEILISSLKFLNERDLQFIQFSDRNVYFFFENSNETMILLDPGFYIDLNFDELDKNQHSSQSIFYEIGMILSKLIKKVKSI